MSRYFRIAATFIVATLFLILAIPAHATVYSETLGIGANGPEVLSLQTFLQGEGFYSSTTPATGYFGDVTSAAVAKYQLSIGLPAVGVVGPKTLAALNSTVGENVSTTTIPTITRYLSIGDTGIDVSELQSFLKTLGLYTYPSITGYYGAITEAAVKAFQTANNIQEVGVVGPITLSKIANIAEAESNSPSNTTGPLTSTPRISSGGGGSSGYSGGGGYTAPDVTAPIVAMTAPTSGSTVSGSSVTLTASSTDNVAVAGVTFYINGSMIGSEVPNTGSELFSTIWDSTATSSGTYTIFAVSRDTSNNYATSTTVSFTVSNPAPAISAIASSTATTTATVTWNTDQNANSEVVYGTTTAYGLATSSAALDTTHSLSLTGLATSTLYHFAVVSANTVGDTATSSDQTFTTLTVTTAPTVTTSAATSISSTGATFNGAITADGGASSTVEGFNYGLTTDYTATSSISGTFGVGSFATSSPALSPSTTYYYRAFATNSAGTGYGSDQSFTTAMGAPVISAVNASPNVDSVIITWTTDQPTSSTVLFGPTTSYGAASTNPALVTSHNIGIIGLYGGTLYHFQVECVNSAGTVSTSSDQTFETYEVAG